LSYRWVSCLFFLIAFAELLAEGRGTLAVPGAAAALAGAVFSAKGWDELAALTGMLAASASFAAQGFLGRCEVCTAAALSFALGGLAAGAGVFAQGGRKVLKAACAASAFMLLASSALYVHAGPLKVHGGGSILRYGGAPAPAYEAAPGTPAGQVGGPPAGSEDRVLPKALLYISPFCASCEEAVIAAVRSDPGGVRWEPVVVPELAFRVGEDKLRGLGYSGRIRISAASPVGAVPCLVLPDGRILKGAREVAAWFQETARKEDAVK